MGNFLRMLARRIFEYPIKRQPICFLRQEDFTSSGEPVKSEVRRANSEEDEEELDSNLSKYEPKRKKSTFIEDENVKSSLKKTVKKFPGWDEQTIVCLHNLFLLFEDKKKAALSLEDFCAILESLGESSTFELRDAKFQEADVNGDGWLSYAEFLPAMYNYNPPKRGRLQGLGKLCLEASENVKFVSSLTVAEQLRYGLF